MGILGDLENLGGDVVDGVKDVAEIGKDIVMAPADIAHWVLTKMFGGSDGDVHLIATELSQLGKDMDGLAKEIGAALSKLTWHGPASDAFVHCAEGRVREINKIAYDLSNLSTSVDRLTKIY